MAFPARPFVFLRIGWMDRYSGLTNDKISGGGSFVEQHGFGHEMYNFADIDGKLYGYVRPPGGRGETTSPNLNIRRLGAAPGAKSVEGVLCIWVATRPETKKQVIVGLYRNSTVFGQAQKGPSGSIRIHENEMLDYYFEVQNKDALLLPKDQRLIEIPSGKGWLGQSNIRYGNEIDENSALGNMVKHFLEFGNLPPVNPPVPGKQTDVLKRQRVEETAIKKVASHFAGLGFTVTSVERDNVGWDLEAQHGELKLLVEVKGLSGTDISVELTPNEFFQMEKNIANYRLCVVTNALNEPLLNVFSYVPEVGAWETEDQKRLKIVRIESARCRLADCWPNQ